VIRSWKTLSVTSVVTNAKLHLDFGGNYKLKSFWCFISQRQKVADSGKTKRFQMFHPCKTRFSEMLKGGKLSDNE